MQGVQEATLPQAGRVEARAEPGDLSALRKALYSSANLGIGGLDYIVAVFLLKYYTNYTGLDAKWAGVALLLGKAFDAVTDPVMGYLSDRTKSRWGRRRPWFLVGGIPLALSFVLMFSASPDWSQTTLFVWLVATNVLFWAGNTIVDVPHAALGSEITYTHRQRISLMGWRQGFQSLGLLLGGLAMFVLLERAMGEARHTAQAAGLDEHAVAEVVRVARGQAHTTITAWLGLAVLAATALVFFGTREPEGPRTPPRDTLFGDFADTFRSAPFRLFALALIIGQIADGLTASLALYTIEEWWGFSGAHPRYIMLGYVGIAVWAIPFWMRVAAHFEKRLMLALGTFMASAGLVGMLFVPRLGLWWAYLAFYFAGIGFGGRMVMTMAMMPDVIDDDEYRTHTRKDGAYFGMFSLLRKLARAAAMGLSGIGLAFFGYVSGAAEQGPQAVRGIIIMFCIVPAVASAITATMLLWFPITRGRHDAIVDELARRRQARLQET